LVLLFSSGTANYFKTLIVLFEIHNCYTSGEIQTSKTSGHNTVHIIIWLEAEVVFLQPDETAIRWLYVGPNFIFEKLFKFDGLCVGPNFTLKTYLNLYAFV
jgi:hypothetical protein